MRAVGIIALSIAAVATGAASASPTSTTARPSVRVSDLNPFTVRGTNFKARERVRVVISSKKHRTTRTVTANGRGSFRTAFAFKLRGCDEYSVRATGGGGSRAAVKSSQQSCGADIGPV
jgi:hypothetical protein